jgi:hypothetical protein
MSNEAESTETEAPAEAPRKRGRPKKPPITLREVDPDEPDPEAMPDYAPAEETPIDSDAAASKLMVEVTRTGGGVGPGWVGDTFDGTPVSIGRVGSYPQSTDVYDRIQRLVGGGRYRFTGKTRDGKHFDYEKPLPGAPFPLPAEAEQQAQGIYPNNAAPNARGGFERLGGGDPRFFGLGGQNVVFEEDRGEDPFQDEDYNPEIGIDPSQLPQAGLTGWFRGGPYDRIRYYVNGVPSRPPKGHKCPAALMGGAPSGGVDVDPEPKKDSELTELLKALLAKPPVDPMAGYAAMMKAQADADRLRWEQERAAADRRAADDRAAADRKAAADKGEADRRWEDEKLRRESEFKLMMARLDKESQIAESRKDNEVKIAEINAAAEKDKAAAVNASNDKLFNILLKKSDDVGLLERGMRLGNDLSGGKSTIGEVGNLINDAIPKLTDAAVTYAAYRSGGASAVAGGVNPGDPGEDDMLARFVSVIVENYNAGTPPDQMPKQLYSICLFSQFPKDRLKSFVSLATPAVAGKILEAQAARAVDPNNKASILRGRDALMTPAGQNWFNAVKAAVAGRAPATASVVPVTVPAVVPPKIISTPICASTGCGKPHMHEGPCGTGNGAAK